MLSSEDIRKKFLDFFKGKGHAIIPSAPLVPENDSSTLFTTAGMQPLVPYLLGEKHPSGKRVANVQKCVRTGDIDEVGDSAHLTFFEMLGNWSFGDYFKEEAIKFSYEFLTDKEKGLGLKPERLYITVFEGNKDAPKDTESFEIWKQRGIPEERIYFMSAEKNWWSAGDSGPCGPDTEMYYDITKEGLNLTNKDDFLRADKEQKAVEIWNDVFMEYEKKNGKVVGKLSQKNVDTGAGLERMAMVLQGKKSVFETDLFAPIVAAIGTKTVPFGKENPLHNVNHEKAKRIIADHLRAAVFAASDNVVPSNIGAGYVLRRLIRRAAMYSYYTFGIQKMTLLTDLIINAYKKSYLELERKKNTIKSIICDEESKFRKTIDRGLKEFEKGADPFVLFATYGFPIEMTKELAKERGARIDEEKFRKDLKKHQELSRATSGGMFKGGLADAGPKTTALHTTTHLMLAGLRKYLGAGIHQAGSNITPERTRFDFTYSEKVSADILKKVEDYVNEAIGKKCDVVLEQISKVEAQKSGVEGSFWEKYPDTVNVYTVKAPDGAVFSRELCGGPHVGNTGEIKGTFKIIKEESSSAGVRRIKAVLDEA